MENAALPVSTATFARGFLLRFLLRFVSVFHKGCQAVGRQEGEHTQKPREQNGVLLMMLSAEKLRSRH